MRQSIATIVVAYVGLIFLPYAFFAIGGLAGGKVDARAIPLLLLGAAGVLLIVMRREIGSWLIRDATDDGSAMPLGLVRAVGLFLIANSVAALPQYFVTFQMTAAMKLMLAAQSTFALLKIAIGVFALLRPAAIVALIDSRGRPTGEHSTADIAFGVVALWLLIVSVAKAAQSAIGSQIPELAGGVVASAIALWAFVARGRLGARWSS